MSKYYGKYRAFVSKNNDPENRGRIRVTVPSLLGDGITNWCDCCIPVAYDNGGDFFIPQIGETVWIEFEEGDIDKPVWTGNWFSQDSTPFSNYSDAQKNRVISFGDCRILMNNETNTMTITSNETKIVLETSKMTLTSNGSEIVLNSVSIGKLNSLINSCDAILTHITT